MSDPASSGRDPDPVGGLPEHPPCPFCEGSDTELVSAFGSHASVATYWCRDCRSPFELLKWRGTRGAVGGGSGAPAGSGGGESAP